MKEKATWSLVGVLVIGLALFVVSCGGTTADSGATTVAPTTQTTAVAPTTPPPAPPTSAAPTPAASTPAPAPTTTAAAPSGPPNAPKAVHASFFATNPAGCTGCHSVGAAGVGVLGGTGMPGPSAGANDHTGRTSDMCKGCHQLSS